MPMEGNDWGLDYRTQVNADIAQIRYHDGVCPKRIYNYARADSRALGCAACRAVDHPFLPFSSRFSPTLINFESL